MDPVLQFFISIMLDLTVNNVVELVFALLGDWNT